MKESCFCGRTGEVEDREPVPDGEGGRALRCPDCGHLDYLGWLSDEAGSVLWGEARRRHESPAKQRRVA